MLEIRNLSAGYKSGVPALQNFFLTMQSGERIGITGQNGSGKSTLAKAIMGLTPWINGELLFEGNNLFKLPAYQRNKLGIAFFMQGGRVYRQLTVAENLRMATNGNKSFSFERELQSLSVTGMALFNNARRMALPAGNLSGGERHILAFIMTILSCPKMKLLIADEPSAGISHKIQNDLLKGIDSFLSENIIGLILIEQNITFLKKLTSSSIKIK